MLRSLRAAILVFLAFAVLTGIVYPLVVTGIGQVVFPAQANGSVIRQRGKVIGSALIGQEFTNQANFWGRPSATTPPYNGAASSGSNLSPTNPVLIKEIRQRVAALKAADPQEKGPVPVDLVTASGSGLDPDISIAAALYQVDRVAKARGLSPGLVRRLVAKYTQGRQLGVLGEPVVNVLALNLALDRLRK